MSRFVVVKRKRFDKKLEELQEQLDSEMQEGDLLVSLAKGKELDCEILKLAQKIVEGE